MREFYHRAYATLSSMKAVDFLAIGDPVVDEFIRLKDANITCDIDNSNCTISMRFADKIPFEFAVTVAGVGNAGNAAVAAARLGLSSALLGHIGKDLYGSQIKEVYRKEGMDLDYLIEHEDVPTNHHYVLWYESERTILVKHEKYEYFLPNDLPTPKAIYLSSLGADAGPDYYQAINEFKDAHPDIFLLFQPGTFQIKMGVEALKRTYEQTDLYVVNKEEAERVLGHAGEIAEQMKRLHALGPKNVIITDGRAGAYASDGTKSYVVPMYPDPREPYERTGAGDAFSSAVTAAMTMGKPFEEALLWGPIESMNVVQKIGAQEGLVSLPQMEEYLAEAPPEYKLQEF